MIMGPPSSIISSSQLGRTGVDEQTGLLFRYEGDRLSSLFCSVRVESAVDAALIGTKGRIRIHPWWIRPDKLTLTRDGQEDVLIEMPYEGGGYQFEAVEVMECLRAGRLESQVIPLDETLSIMRTLDTIRAQMGLRYPQE
jgi:predicted dehydrogenase